MIDDYVADEFLPILSEHIDEVTDDALKELEILNADIEPRMIHN